MNPIGSSQIRNFDSSGRLGSTGLQGRSCFSTDGRIPAYNLVSLIDNKKLFPPYHAAPVVRQDALDVHPGLREALAPLGSLIDNGTMMGLNYEVDEKKRAVSEVVREFLRSKKII